MSGTVQKIKERLNITDVVGSYIDLEKAGASFKAKCPFHNERTPSFFVSPERGTFYCFGCGTKGDIFSFVEDFERVDFVGALKMLAERAGVVIEKFEREENKNERLYEAMEEATRFFQENLKAEKDALSYLQRRHLKIEMVRDWRLGFARAEWRSLKEHLKERGFSEREATDAGLIKESAKENNSKESYDRFRGRVMFPIFDTAGRVIAFSGRLLADKEGEPKYLNSPDTALFDKSRVLYGYHAAKKAIREKGFAILVEGQMDLLLSHQAGFGNTVASSGTALSPDHLASLRRLSDTLILAYDADNAGRNATFRAWKLCLSFGFDLKIAVLPEGVDPADAVAKDERIWRQAVEKAANVIDYFLEIVKSEKDEKAADKILKEKVLPLVKSVENSITQSRFVQKASFATGLAENALWDELEKIKDDEISEAMPKAKAAKESTGARRSLAFLLWLRSIGNGYADEFEASVKRILPDLDLATLASAEDKDALIFEMEMHYGNDANLKQVGENLLKYLEEDALKRDLAQAMERLKKAEATRDTNIIERELSLCREISEKLSRLLKQPA